MKSGIDCKKSISFEKSHDLVLGSSVVRDLDQSKLINTDVVSISGGRIRDAHEHLKKCNDTYNRITLVIGGNDCAARSNPEPLDILASQYSDLLDEAKSHASEVFVI